MNKKAMNDLLNKDGLLLDSKVLNLVKKQIKTFTLKHFDTKFINKLHRDTLKIRGIISRVNYIEEFTPELFTKLERISLRKGIHSGILLHIALISEDNFNPYCEYCGNITAFNVLNFKFKRFCNCTCSNRFLQPKREASCMAKHGVKNVSQVKEYQENRKQTHIKLYGVENAFQSKVIKEKIKSTMLERYGADHPMHVQEHFDKMQLTCLKNNGTSTPFANKQIRQKGLDTMKERYGETHWTKIPELVEKVKANSLKKWGNERPQSSLKYKKLRKKKIQKMYGADYTHPLQVPKNHDHQQKSMSKTFAYIKKDKTYESLRGYEHFALNYLVDVLKYKVKNIIAGATKGVPSFKYKDGTQIRHYFPDFLVSTKDEEFIVEVKSTYTAGLKDAKTFNLLKKKAKAVENAGHTFVLLIMGENGQLLLDYTGIPISRTQLRTLIAQ